MRLKRALYQGKALATGPLIAALVFLGLACGSTESPAPSPTAPPLQTTALRATATPRPAPTPQPSPTPVPELAPGTAVVVGGELRTRKEPSTQSEVVGTLPNLAKVEIAARVRGENWLVGSQTWPTSTPSWATEWFKLTDGSYVYGAFVFLLLDGESSPLAKAPTGEDKWIDVDIRKQQARAMVGDRSVFTAPISSGQAPFNTPQGTFAILPDGRVAVEKMTATQAGYDPKQAQYDVERVLFTQYFDQAGNALHLNYWRPHSVFGHTATSHGCIGLELHEAQYLWLFASAGTRVVIHG